VNARPRPSHALRFSLTAFSISIAAVFALFAGCGLNTQGIPGNGGGGGSKPCAKAAQCDDDNPCTVDSCSAEGVCVYKDVADGTATPDQVAGDCKTTRCKGGQPKDEDDDNDIPDDNQDCTFDTCANGMASHTAKMDGTACVNEQKADGQCSFGKCKVICTDDSKCALTPPNPCVTPRCDLSVGQCIYPAMQDGMETPGVQQIPGDCHRRICLGGKDVDQIDDSDLPVTATDCDQEKCDNGVPSNPPNPPDSPCSTNSGQVCDGAGTCVQCNPTSVAKCPGSDTDCQQRSCTNHVCGISYQPATTAAAQQIPGDCHKVFCDGNGGYQTLVDDTDKPTDPDGCHPGICANGVGSNGIAPNSTPCGTALACLNGACSGCTMDNQCTAPSTCGGGGMANVCGCTPTVTSCSGTNPTTTCGTIPNGCGQTINCNDGVKDGGETDVDCGGGSTAMGACSQKCGQGKQCKVDTDCSTGHCADGVCCDTACGGKCQACSAAKKGQGSDGVCGPIKSGLDPDTECAAQDKSTCGNVGGCNGAGACSPWPNGTVCKDPSCMNGTLDKADTCVNGTCTPPNPNTVTCSPYLCSSATACGTSCASDNDCIAGDWCSGNTCVAKKANGQGCTGGNQCTSTFCVDGVCCGTACTGACNACLASLKQSNNATGTCGAAKNGAADPRGVCQMTATPASGCGLDGMCNAGACEKWPNTTVCANASCTNGTASSQALCDGNGTCGTPTTTMCAPYSCGATTCNTSCGMGVNADDTKCATGNYCDPTSGMCAPKVGAGSACTVASACTTGACLGGFCCASACATASPCGATACAMTTGACVYPVLTVCQAGTCSSDNLSGLKVCDQNGTCNPAATLNCPNGACTTNGCTSCVNDAQCTGLGYCNGGTCAAKKPSGSSCGNNKECLSGTCSGTTCT
jgi:hypothetical protein